MQAGCQGSGHRVFFTLLFLLFLSRLLRGLRARRLLCHGFRGFRLWRCRRLPQRTLSFPTLCRRADYLRLRRGITRGSRRLGLSFFRHTLRHARRNFRHNFSRVLQTFLLVHRICRTCRACLIRHAGGHSQFYGGPAGRCALPGRGGSAGFPDGPGRLMFRRSASGRAAIWKYWGPALSGISSRRRRRCVRP